MMRPKWLYPILVVVIGAFQIWTIKPESLYNEDACLFLSHARNLALKQPYGATHFVYTAEAATYSPSEYPPVLPIMMVPIYRVSGLHLYPYKIMITFVLLLSIIIIDKYYRRRLTTSQRLLLLALLGFCPFITELKNEILSDIPFLLFVYMLFLLVNTIDPNETKDYWVSGILAGLLSYLAYGTRTIGVGLVPCIIIFGLLRYRRVLRFSIVASVVFIVLASVQSRFVSSDSDYLRGAFLDVRTPLRNLHFYVGTASLIWDAGIGSSTRIVIFAIATCLFFVGAWRAGREPLDIASVFFVGYALFLVFWPIHQARYLLPLLPVHMYFILRGLYAVRELISRSWSSAGRIVTISLACILLFAYFGKYRTSNFEHRSEGFDDSPSMQFYDFIRNATPQNAVFVAGAPRAIALYAGRQAARFPDRMDKENLIKYVNKVNATYLVASPVDNPQWLSLCKSISRAEPIFSNQSYIILKR